jgi:uncharacterized membrane protein
MKINSKQQPKKNKNRSFWTIFEGDFLLNAKLKKLYPYCIFLVLLAGIIIFNEKRIDSKERIYRQVEAEHKKVVEELKKKNLYFSFEENELLELLLKEKGFLRNPEQVYVITKAGREE